MGIDDVIPTRDELLEELAGELLPPDIPEGAITVRDLMLATGMSDTTCYTKLQEKVDAGVLQVVMIKGTNYYYKNGAKSK